MSNKNLIKAATSKLKFRDIYLYQSRFERPNNGNKNNEYAVQQNKVHTGYRLGKNSDGEDILQAIISFGSRVITDKEDPDNSVLFIIEADFVVEYALSNDLNSNELRAFVDFNAVHNAWPFWRQHVIDVVQRANLPRLEVPFFMGMQLDD